jgi:hypothetical protein
MSYIGNAPLYQAFITDTFSGNGSTTAFTMTVAPANTASVLVAVSGVLQAPSTYSVNGTTLTFSAAPPSGTANISVRYLGIPASGVTTTAYSTRTEFTATAGQTTFTTASYTAGFIQVYRNGVLLGTSDYTATNGTTVVLASGATAGDLITTISFYVSSVLNAIPNTAGSVANTNLGAISSFKTPSANTITVPDVAGTAMVSGNMPAFSYYCNSAQTLSAGTTTKIQINTKVFDTANCFDATTNYRFTPNVAGYYQVNANLFTTSITPTPAVLEILIYKNGTDYAGAQSASNGTNRTNSIVSRIIYMNGTTDYIEMYGLNGGSATVTVNNNVGATAGDSSYFEAVLVRSA